MPQQFHDEETSSSEDSVYFTPEISFTHSVIPPISSTPAGIQLTSSDFQSVYQTPKKTSVRSFLTERLSSSGRKLILDAMNDKENISCSKLAKSSVSISSRHLASTPLKCITNIATSARIASDIPATVKSHTKRNSIIDTNIISTKLNNVKKNESRSRRSFLQRLGVNRKSTSKYKVLKESLVSDVSLNDSDEAIVIRIPKKNYGTICCEKSNIEVIIILLVYNVRFMFVNLPIHFCSRFPTFIVITCLLPISYLLNLWMICRRVYLIMM